MAQKIIDVHAHFLSQEYFEFIDKHNATLEDGFPLPTYDLEKHKQLMKECNIEYSLLSVSSPQPYFESDISRSLSLIRSVNEQMAEIKRNDPQHFGFQALLPLPNVEASIKEAIYALDVLHADGIKLASNTNGLYLGDKSLDSLMQVLNDRHAICNIHPHKPSPIKEGIFSSGPVPLFEFLADTTRAVLNLISNGIILKYPNITWIIPHCGSFLPNIYDRFIGLSKVLVPQGFMEEIDVQESFKKLYFDTSGNPAPHLLDWLLTITTSDHILYGSDYPFTPASQIKNNLSQLTTMLDSESLKDYKSMILYDNAKKLIQK